MKAVRKIIEHAEDSIVIELPAELRNQKLEIIILAASEQPVVNEHTEAAKPVKYDFSDIVGKFSWKGDAVAEQRKLRDEWE